MTETGQVLAVNARVYGDVLAAPASAGATSITVEDGVDFSPDGGWLVVNDQTVEYDACDVTTGVITLVGTLPAAVSEGDRVDVWDPETETVVTDVVAQVQVGGALGNDDAAEAVITHALVGYLPEGIREADGETVTLERRGQTLYVTNIRHREASFDGQVVWNPHSVRSMDANTIPNTTWEEIAAWTDIETDGITTTSTSWIIEYEGFYSLRPQAAFVDNANGQRRIRAMVNGAEAAFKTNTADVGNASTFVDASIETRLAVGDEVTVEVWQSSGAGLALSTGDSRCYFSIHRISM